MTCPSELNLSMYADGELRGAEVSVTEAHLSRCAMCRARLDGLRTEVAVVTAALAHEMEQVSVPAFEGPVSHGALAAAAAFLLVGAALVSAMPVLIAVSLPAPLTWLNPLDGRDLADLAWRVVLYLADHGGAIMTGIAEAAAAAVVVGLVTWTVFGLRSSRPGPLLLVSLATAVVVLPAPAEAFEIRRGDDGDVLIPADETITDTLIAFGETIEVNGDVEGDLLAFGRRVVIRGRVGGQVFTAARAVTLDGEVGGSVLGFAQTVDVSSARIGGNLYGFGNTINASDRMSIGRNAMLFAQHASIAGPVGHDLLGFGEEIEIADTVGGSVTAYARRVILLAPARVAGDVSVHVPREESLTVSPGAVIDGELTTDIRQKMEDESDYTTGGFYLAQVLRFGAAFTTGVILLALVPRLRRVSLDTVRTGLVAGAFGIVTLVATPIIAVLVAVTVVGIPVALLSLLLWLAGLYLAKIVLAHFIGRRFMEALGRPAHFALALAVGLLLVLVVVNLPFVGGLLNFVLTVCGLGVLVLFLWRMLRGAPEAGDVPV